MSEAIELNWSCHTPNLLKELLNNPGTGALIKPLQIFGHILFELGERAAELNDPKLNALMCRLTLYEMADPEMPDFDRSALDEIYKLAEEVTSNE